MNSENNLFEETILKLTPPHTLSICFIYSNFSLFLFPNPQVGLKQHGGQTEDEWEKVYPVWLDSQRKQGAYLLRRSQLASSRSPDAIPGGPAVLLSCEPAFPWHVLE